MKRNYLKFIVVLVVFVILQGCTKSKQCECNTPFVFGNYYQPGDVVSNRGACWTPAPGTVGDYLTQPDSEPMDTFPIQQDIWIKLCEK
ncbi:MAG: hypothetical protein V4667_04770 [Bacteroidota bacterium]